MTEALRDPLGAARLAARLFEQARGLGLETRVSSDFEALARLRKQVRGKIISPMFDPEAAALSPERAFWTGQFDNSGQCVALNAFRLDHVEPNLGHWVLGWMVGLYMRRSELIVPSHLEPPAGTRSSRVAGRLVYHGEAWIDPKAVRAREAVEILPLLGMMLAYVKWNPDALWAVGSASMATRGLYARFGYPSVEPAFLRWEWLPDGADAIEWLALAERSDLEFIVQRHLDEMDGAREGQMSRMSTLASADTTETPLLPSGKRAGSTTR